MHKSILLIILCCIPFILSAQFQQTVLPGLEGQELFLELVKQYKPNSVLSYGDARDTLYSKVYKRNDSVYCVYSGYALYLPDNVDPSTHLLKGGDPDGINTEHTYPQSKGAGEGNPRSDMHHLFPTRAFVNSARGNAAFAEINDNDTDFWYYKTIVNTSIPSANRDLYSEKLEMPFFGDNRFEPKEQHKGNVARAVFYFYTMYKSQANAADPAYFELQRETLCNWHFDDPVDSLEWTQNFLKAAYQDNRPNPYILDCTLPQRTYCENMGLSCIVSVNEAIKVGLTSMSVYPVPFVDRTNIQYSLSRSADVRIEVVDLLGSVQYQVFSGNQSAGEYSFEWVPAYNTSSGLYFLRLMASNSEGQVVEQRKIILK